MLLRSKDYLHLNTKSISNRKKESCFSLGHVMKNFNCMAEILQIFVFVKDCQFPISKFQLSSMENHKIEILLTLFWVSVISDFRYWKPDTLKLMFLLKLFFSFVISDIRYFRYRKSRSKEIISTWYLYKTLLAKLVFSFTEFQEVFVFEH